MSTFFTVNPRVDFAEQERRISSFWKERRIFEKSVQQRVNSPSYTFYDGPPFATGLPHYGHLLQSTIKDIVPRYWAMKGYHVPRRWGWDCHGLPVENLIEKEMNIACKKDIERIGVATFNETCRGSVLRCASDWSYYVEKLGRWVDFQNDYKTMNPDYMESIWWIFKQLWDQGLIYEGYKSMHICPRCSTSLSNFEVTLGYKDTVDTSAIVKFPLIEERDTFVLAWTTTPWTLPANTLLAVGSDIVYQKIALGSEVRYILAKDTIPHVIHHKYEVLDTFTGKDLIGQRYTPLFEKDFSSCDYRKVYEIVIGDFVSVEGEGSGTGVVHIAPAFGEDDLLLAQKEQAPFFQHVNMEGVTTGDIKGFPSWKGLAVEDLTAKVISNLQERRLLFHAESYKHSYPFCWRCDTKLINYATSSWFVAVTQLKDRLIENNHHIHWVPGHIQKGRFGEWLHNARDWAISRSRYWGTPLPVWRCDDTRECVVIGSRKELEQLAGQQVSDLHKHYVDQIAWRSPQGGVMRRVPEVLDCWFESGAMPYASFHYPFENAEEFSQHFPADFIAEGIDQTRGWFYTLHVLSTALFDKPSSKNIMCVGLVLAEDGQKMSKSKKNYPDPLEVLDKYGADAFRFFLVNSPVVQGEELCFSEKRLAEFFRNFVLMLWNSYSFFITYAQLNNYEPSVLYQFFCKVSSEKQIEDFCSHHILDRWILARLHEVTSLVTTDMHQYELYPATRHFQPLLSDISKWYIRRSRDRFQENDIWAFRTMYTVMLRVAQLLAPFMPFISEEIYQQLTGCHYGAKIGSERDTPDSRHDKACLGDVFQEIKESVHLCDYPTADERFIDRTLLEQMDLVRAIAEVGNRERREKGIKVRQPLASLTVVLSHKHNIFLEKIKNDVEKLLCDELNVKAVHWEESEVGGEVRVDFDMAITEDLLREGMMRDLVRHIQSERQHLGLQITDKIVAIVDAPKDLQTFLQPVCEDIRELVGSHELKWGSLDDQKYNNKKSVTINGVVISIYVEKFVEC